MPIVNGHQADTGCYVDGHWGQYGPDHLEDQARAFGYDAAQEFGPQYWRVVADNEALPQSQRDEAWEFHTESADEIEQWLNDRTEAGYSWGWYEGEFYLWSTESWEETP